VLTEFWQGNLRERDHLDDGGRDWRIVLKLTLQNMMGEEPELD
jgi:hypothetical protein